MRQDALTRLPADGQSVWLIAYEGSLLGLRIEEAFTEPDSLRAMR